MSTGMYLDVTLQYTLFNMLYVRLYNITVLHHVAPSRCCNLYKWVATEPLEHVCTGLYTGFAYRGTLFVLVAIVTVTTGQYIKATGACLLT